MPLGGQAAPQAPPALPRRLLWRAWPLEATWHAERMQGLGVLYALWPVLRRQRDVAAAVQRHAVAFGCNLWTAPTLLGAMARLESDARGDDAVRLRDELASPLSGAGDLFVWRAVRPGCLSLAVLGVLSNHPLLGIAVAAIVHDAALAWRHERGFARGWRHGMRLEGDFAAALPSHRAGRWVQKGLLLLGGGFAGWGLAGAWGAAPSTAFLMSGTLLVGYYAARRQFPPGMTFVGLICVAAWLRRFSNPVGLR